MPKLRRKSSVCYNCGEQLVNSENYCPNCGQENHNRQASTSLLIKDFVDTCLSFDSKLFMTMRPLLFQPGTLSKEYLDGKRVKFVPPIRLFIFLSFLYFGISLVIGDQGSICSTDMQFITAVVEFGLLLRDSEYKGTANFERILKNARQGLGRDSFGYRSEFIQLVRKTQRLKLAN